MYDKGIGWVGDVLDKVSLRIVVVLSHENLSAYDDFVIVMVEYYFVMSSYWKVLFILVRHHLMPKQELDAST